MMKSIDAPIFDVSFEEGDGKCFDEIYRHYAPEIYFYCKRSLADSHDAQDVVLHAIVQLWRRREEISGNERKKRFLYRAARNKIIDLHRKRQAENRRLTLDDAFIDIPVYQPDKEELTRKAMTIDHIKMTTVNLPPRCKQVIDLFLDYKTIPEIALILRLSYKTVYAHFTTGSKKICTELNKKLRNVE